MRYVRVAFWCRITLTPRVLVISELDWMNGRARTLASDQTMTITRVTWEG